MNTIDAIKERRAVKNYDPSHVMSDEEINSLIDLAMLSPTAFNIQHWRFVVVKNPELRAKIKGHAWGQAQVTDASLLIILCADTKAWQKEPARYWKEAPVEVKDFMVSSIENYYSGREQVQRDEALRSCGIAAQTIMLAAKEMGYDSCPMDGFDFDAVSREINLPEDHLISMFVVVGKALTPARPRSGSINREEVLIVDTFGA